MRGLTAAALLLIAFAAIAALALGGHLQDFDRALMLLLRTDDGHDPVGPRWVELTFLEITDLGSNAIVTLITLAAAGFLFMDGKRATAWLVLASVIGGTLLNNLLKLMFDRPRPDLVAHAVEVQTTSFPSGHAMMAAIAYLTLGALLARTQKRFALRVYILCVAGFIAALIGISRIYLGVHWPTDILAGWCAGAAWALICWEIASALQRSGDVEKPGR